jgi:CheY-specific phosphatase CheX
MSRKIKKEQFESSDRETIAEVMAKIKGKVLFPKQIEFAKEIMKNVIIVEKKKQD